MFDISWSGENCYQHIYQIAKENASASFEQGKVYIIKVLKLVMKVNDIIKTKGLLAVEDFMNEMKVKVPFDRVWREAMFMAIDGGELEPVIEYLLNDYFTREENTVTTWIFLIYICSMRCIGEYRKKILKQYYAEENPELLKELEEESEEDANIALFLKEIMDIIPGQYKIKEMLR